ncbi:hypothetical protein [Sporosarcina sp. P2]|nr:hypothetical protein [Sporosarcina sp. P2]
MRWLGERTFRGHLVTNQTVACARLGHKVQLISTTGAGEKFNGALASRLL